MNKFNRYMIHILPKIGNIKPIKKWLFNYFDVSIVDADNGRAEIYIRGELYGTTSKENAELAVICSALSCFKIVQKLIGVN